MLAWRFGWLSMPTSADELDAHFGPDGPVAAARCWLELVLARRDLEEAWSLTDPTFRRRLAEAWTDAADAMAPPGADRMQVVEELAREPVAPTAPWRAFADDQLRAFARLCRFVDLTGSGWASRPSAESPGYELIVLADHGEDLVLEEPASLPAFGMLMHHHPARGWLVADLS